MRLDGLVVLGEFIDRLEADLLVAALRSEGIPATTNEDSRRSMLGGGLLGPGTHGADPVLEVLVPSERLDDAREVMSASSTGDSLPPEFRDEVWTERVAGRNRTRRNIKRRWVLACIYAMFGLVVMTFVAGFVLSLR